MYFVEMKTAQDGIGELYQRDWGEKQAERAQESRDLAKFLKADSRVGL